MLFGMTGPVPAAGGRLLRLVPFALAALAGLLPPAAAAQTDCALPMPVPAAAEIELQQQPTLRGPGLLITWPDLDPAQATCTALRDTAGLGLTLDVGGAYLDEVDRRLRFEFTTNGSVADAARNDFTCEWSSRNPARNGRIGGRINLSNTGGLWVRDAQEGWLQRNEGLPNYFRFTNIVDAAASGDGRTILAALTAGATFDANPRGLFLARDGGPWVEIAPETFGRGQPVSLVAMAPHSSDRFAAGTPTSGIFVTADGGATFTQWTSALDPGFGAIPNRFVVSELAWTDAGLLAAVENFGLFLSTDDGQSFTRLPNVTVPDGSGSPLIPRVTCLAVDPSDGDRLLLGLTSTLVPARNGVYEYDLQAQTLTSLHTSFVGLPEGGIASPGARKIPLGLFSDGSILVMSTQTQGFWYSPDGTGDVWYEMATPFTVPGAPGSKPLAYSIVRDGDALFTQMPGQGIFQWDDAQQEWTTLDPQPFNRNARTMLGSAAGLVLATIGGGVFTENSEILIENTISSALTDSEWLDAVFGLTLVFGPGSVTLQENPEEGTLIPRYFELMAQTFQGWVVWRADGSDPNDMAMIGRFDRTNPETCIEGFCGDDSYVIDPRCFSERLAACFDFSRQGYVSFYDENIFNGFTYYYAVTPFDFGDLALLSDPSDLAAPLFFPPRFAGDPLSEPRFEGDTLPSGPGNRRSYQINTAAEPPADGKEVYVYPNPLRRGRGIAGGEGEEVVWTNLPPESKIQVFTLAGDHIADLPQDDKPQQGGNIFWTTRNHNDDPLAAGIYVWRLIMPQRGDFWGKLVIIR